MTRTQSHWLISFAIIFLSASLVACGGEDAGEEAGLPGDQPLNPEAQPSEVAKFLQTRIGNLDGGLESGNPPAATVDAGAPTISLDRTQVDVYSGRTFIYRIEYSGDSPLGAIYSQVEGASNFIEYPFYETTTGLNESLDVNVIVHTDIGTGQFCMYVSAEDLSERVSEPVRLCTDVDRELMNAVQGEWVSACSARDSRSFIYEWDIDHGGIESRTTAYNTADCSGSVSETFTRTLNFSVEGENLAEGGVLTYDVIIVDLTDDYVFSNCIMQATGASFKVGCSEQPDTPDDFQDEFFPQR